MCRGRADVIMPEYGAVDLGATNVRALVADPGGGELGAARRRTPQSDGSTVAGAVVATLERACADAGCDPEALAAVGVGSIGPLDADAGAVVEPPNVPADRIDLVDALGERTGARVTLTNDAVAGVLGERRFGDLPEHGVYLTLSTGVGAGAVVGGHVLRGRRGNAVEVGHLSLVPGGRPCGCGGTGHWEAYASGRGIAAAARDLARDAPAGSESGPESATDPDPEALDAAAVVAAADRDAAVAAAGPEREVGAPFPTGVDGDPLATRVVADAVTVTARGLAAVTHAYAPAVVSVGGAVALSNPSLFVAPMTGLLADAGLAVPAPVVRETPLGESAVLRGALASVLPERPHGPSPDHNG
jgi:glucokinase